MATPGRDLEHNRVIIVEHIRIVDVEHLCMIYSPFLVKDLVSAAVTPANNFAT